jgi:hypothetical protein
MKPLEIEWRHLDKDGYTCERCSDTGATIRGLLDTLAQELNPHGWAVAFKETLLTENQVPESNSVYFNGIPIETLLPNARRSDNCCTSCGEILGSPTMCRTIEQDGQTYEAIPAALIREAALNFIRQANK